VDCPGAFGVQHLDLISCDPFHAGGQESDGETYNEDGRFNDWQVTES